MPTILNTNNEYTGKVKSEFNLIKIKGKISKIDNPYIKAIR